MRPHKTNEHLPVALKHTFRQVSVGYYAGHFVSDRFPIHGGERQFKLTFIARQGLLLQWLSNPHRTTCRTMLRAARPARDKANFGILLSRIRRLAVTRVRA